MRVTKRTNIAIRVLMYCAANSDRLVTKSEIARNCNASENHLAQVVNRLGQLGFLETHRGRNGGLELARSAQAITIGAVFRALEAPPQQNVCCADTDSACPLSEACRLRIALSDAYEAFFSHLDEISLETLVSNNIALMQLVRPSVSSRA